MTARFFLSFVTFCVVAQAGNTRKAPFVVFPKKLKQGQVGLVQLPAASTATAVTFGEQNLSLWPCGTQRCALFAVPVDHPVGKAQVIASGATPEKVSVEVKAGKFKVNLLKVDPSLTSPSDEEKLKIEQDKKTIEEAYTQASKEILWSGKFKMPTKNGGGVTSNFGNRRTYNGETKSIHFGVDLRANEKTSIHASNQGKVLLAGNFFFAGNMVLIDHGLGVFTSYAHLSEIAVTPGQMVKTGDRLGQAGATGRVTGPHLHWSAKVNNTPVDPTHLLTTINRAL